MMEEWVTAAMTDETVVAELLVRLKQSQAAASASTVPAVIPLRWGLRLPRSRPGTMTTTNSCDVVSKSKGGGGSDYSTRCSPTTPLSWSGGGGDSPSGTGDGLEETSHRHVSGSPPPPDVRSKGTGSGETTSTIVKRSRKKKTFSELKEEETQLVEERVYLKREIATVCATFKEERVRNENLKKIKIDLNLHYGNEPEKAVCSQFHQREASTSNAIPSSTPTHAKGDSHLQSSSCETDKEISSHDKFFLLPDLNMMPSDEGDCGAETLYRPS